MIGPLRVVAAAVALTLAITSRAAGGEPESVMKDLSVEQRSLLRIEARIGTLAVSAWVDRQDAAYAAGDAVTLFVKPDQDAYITVLDVGTSGRVSVLFPNAAQPDSRVEAHRTLRIGDAFGGYRLRVHGPAGREVVKVIATEKPLDLITFGDSDAAGPYRVLKADSAAVADRISGRLERDDVGQVAVRTIVLRIVSRSVKAS